MKNKFILPVAMAIVLATSVSALAKGKDGVAAVVDGKTIKVEELEKGYKENPQISAQMKFEDFYDKAREVFVNAKLVSIAAQKDKIKESKEYKDQMKLMEEELLKKVYIEKAVEKKVTDKAIADLYKEYKDGFKPGQEAKAKHILVDSEAKAKEVIAKLKKGDKFDAMIKQYHDSNTKGQAELGYFVKEMMVPEFATAAFSMKKGTYSETPVKTQFGYHVIFLEDLRDTKPMSLKEATPQLKNMLSQNSVADIIKDLRKNAKIEEYTLKGDLVK